MHACVWWCVKEGDAFVYMCKSLFPSTQGFYRLGAALVGLERYTDALEAFARGLASDSKQVALLDALIETMLKSPFKGEPFLHTSLWCGLVEYSSFTAQPSLTHGTALA